MLFAGHEGQRRIQGWLVISVEGQETAGTLQDEVTEGETWSVALMASECAGDRRIERVKLELRARVLPHRPPIRLSTAIVLQLCMHPVSIQPYLAIIDSKTSLQRNCTFLLHRLPPSSGVPSPQSVPRITFVILVASVPKVLLMLSLSRFQIYRSTGVMS